MENRKEILTHERLIEIYGIVESNIELFEFQIDTDLKLDSDDILNMIYFYGDRKFPYYKLEGVADSSCFPAFKRQWNHYCNETRDNWLKTWQAIKAQYNPVNNYDMTESELIHHEGNDVIDRELHNEHQEGTISPTETRQYATTYEKTNGSLTGYTTQAVDYNSADNGTDTTSTTHADINRELKRSGNIGVTTSQQMIQSEIELRKFNLKHNIIMQFIKENTYIGGSY